MHLKAYTTSGTTAVVADNVRARHRPGSRTLPPAINGKFRNKAANCLESRTPAFHTIVTASGTHDNRRPRTPPVPHGDRQTTHLTRRGDQQRCDHLHAMTIARFPIWQHPQTQSRLSWQPATGSGPKDVQEFITPQPHSIDWLQLETVPHPRLNERTSRKHSRDIPLFAAIAPILHCTKQVTSMDPCTTLNNGAADAAGR